MHKKNDEMSSMNTEKLAKIFGIDKLSNKYIEYTAFKDDTIGFSIQREYPDNIRYKPPRTSDGRPDRVALIRVACIGPKKKAEKSAEYQTSIFLDIGLYSRYLSNHLDYNFNEADCPTEESVQNSKATPKPIDLQSSDEYVYEHRSKALQNARGEEVSGEKILDELFNKHCSTVHLLKGLSLRWRISSRNIFVKLIDLYIQFNKWLLKSLFGRSLEPDDPA